jgi:hypothetical protein
MVTKILENHSAVCSFIGWSNSSVKCNAVQCGLSEVVVLEVITTHPGFRHLRQSSLEERGIHSLN